MCRRINKQFQGVVGCSNLQSSGAVVQHTARTCVARYIRLHVMLCIDFCELEHVFACVGVSCELTQGTGPYNARTSGEGTN